MKYSSIVAAVICALACAAFTPPAAAGPYADDMAKCMVNSTSPADRTLFVKWMFAAIALHPDVSSMAVISAQQRDELNKNTAAMFQRLLLESCRTETQKALRNEGQQTISYAFEILGRSAAQSLMSEPSVATAMGGFAKYFDQNKLKELSDDKAPAK